MEPLESLQLNAVRPTYVYQEVARELERFIRDGDFRAGDVLPSERDLCAQLGVSRPSLREALRMLELVGLVEMRRGGRTVVGEFDFSLLTEWIGRAIPTTSHSLIDLLTVREALESRAAKLAAVRIGDAELRRLEEVLQRTEEKVQRGEEVLEEDIQFHDVIYRASGNSVISLLVDVIAGLLRGLRDGVLKGAGGGETMLRDHREILAALRAGDPVRAEQTISRHIEGAHRLAVELMRKHDEAQAQTNDDGRAGS